MAIVRAMRALSHMPQIIEALSISWRPEDYENRGYTLKLDAKLSGQHGTVQVCEGTRPKAASETFNHRRIEDRRATRRHAHINETAPNANGYGHHDRVPVTPETPAFHDEPSVGEAPVKSVEARMTPAYGGPDPDAGHMADAPNTGSAATPGSALSARGTEVA